MLEHIFTAFARHHALQLTLLGRGSITGISEPLIVSHHSRQIYNSAVAPKCGKGFFGNIQWDTVSRPLEQAHVIRHALWHS